MSAPTVRYEKDLLGDCAVPSDAYYGVHTFRAAANFNVSGTPIGAWPELVQALAAVKQAAARANAELGLLDSSRADAIVRACEEIRGGALHDQFVVDMIQGGAGTSTNMNANEVIANRGLELLGHARGEYQHLHPLDHVNLGQSTNDAYPTALRLALINTAEGLLDAVAALREAFAAKADEFSGVLKMGRTQMQDAVPMTLGQEFGAFAAWLADDEEHIRAAVASLCEVNMGATAIGTGINTPPEYAPSVVRQLADITGLPIRLAPNLIAATPDTGAFVALSGALRRFAVKLSKICNDLRLLSSGPRAGFGEIVLPAMQAGSSIMPGKVNPVIPEVVNQICFEVIGNDATVAFAAEGGQLQLNAFEPIIAYSLYKSLTHLQRGCDTLRERCVDGIVANEALLREQVERSIGIVTALNPYIGYANATAVAKEALETGASVYDLVLAKGLLTAAELDEILQPEVLTQPRLLKK